jgi:cytochrome b
MNKILVWDLPTRLLHWLQVLALVGAAGIALSTDDDDLAFQYHMLFGFMLACLVVLRLLWGFLGTRYARFGSFLFGPGALLRYLRGVAQRQGQRYAGHNPGAAYATYAMLSLPIGLAMTGVLIPHNEDLRELHEVLAFLLLAAVGAHLVGVAVYTKLHNENIAKSMIDGKKLGEAPAAIVSLRPLTAGLFLALSLGFAALLFSGHRPQDRQLVVFGQTLRLGEAKDETSSEKRHDKSDDAQNRSHGERFKGAKETVRE